MYTTAYNYCMTVVKKKQLWFKIGAFCIVILKKEIPNKPKQIDNLTEQQNEHPLSQN